MKQCYLSGGPYLLFLDFVYEIDGLQFLFFLFLCSFVVFNIPDMLHFVNAILKFILYFLCILYLYLLIAIIHTFYAIKMRYIVFIC